MRQISPDGTDLQRVGKPVLQRGAKQPQRVVVGSGQRTGLRLLRGLKPGLCRLRQPTCLFVQQGTVV